MPHIHTKPGQVDQTATSYIVLLQPGEEPRVYFHMHKKLNRLLPFGGHVELNETVWQAAVHEIKEESGYDLRELQLMQPKLRISSAGKSIVHPQPLMLNTHTFSADHYHADTVFLFTAQQPPQASPAEGESADIRLLSREEISVLTHEQIFEDSQQTALAILDTYLDAWEPVPATSISLELPKY